MNNELNQLILENDNKYAYVVFDDISSDNNTIHKSKKQLFKIVILGNLRKINNLEEKYPLYF
jgi:hypothetical protein